jgi:hypothetical protein
LGYPVRRTFVVNEAVFPMRSVSYFADRSDACGSDLNIDP